MGKKTISLPIQRLMGIKNAGFYANYQPWLGILKERDAANEYGAERVFEGVGV